MLLMFAVNERLLQEAFKAEIKTGWQCPSSLYGCDFLFLKCVFVIRGLCDVMS